MSIKNISLKQTTIFPSASVKLIRHYTQLQQVNSVSLLGQIFVNTCCVRTAFQSLLILSSQALWLLCQFTE